MVIRLRILPCLEIEAEVNSKMAQRRCLLEVIATVLVHRTKEKKVFWEFDFVTMQNTSHNLLLFSAPTWPSYQVIEYHLFTLPFILVVGDHVFPQEQISLPRGLAWKLSMAAVTSADFLPGITRSLAAIRDNAHSITLPLSFQVIEFETKRKSGSENT